MKKSLDVFLHSDLVGELLQDENGRLSFTYDEKWLSKPPPLLFSHSLPYRKEPFDDRECKGFFAGILPDEGKREIIARNLGISAKNDFSMLEQIGGECAGAVTFVPAGQGLPERNYSYRPLTDEALAKILRELPRRPLLAGEDGMRLSLAGAQDKIAVQVRGEKISLPLGGAPSTHILKPAIDRFEGIVFNEAYCMKLASALGLTTAKVEIGHVENIDYLLVERYDRTQGMTPHGLHFERLHQEDFCQALNVSPDHKYQAEGGPSLKQSFDLVREISQSPVIDLRRLLDAVIFNFLIGNHDAHGKNFSFTYGLGSLITGEHRQLAPLYDLLCTVYYPELAQKMAMKIGGEYVSNKVGPKHFEQMTEEAGLSKPMVKKRVLELAEQIQSQLPDISINHPTAQAVAKVIHTRCVDIAQKFQGKGVKPQNALGLAPKLRKSPARTTKDWTNELREGE